MINDLDLIRQFKKDKAEADSGLLRQRKNTIECQEFYEGDFMSYQERVQFNTPHGKRSALVQFNQVKPYVNALKGFMVQNRRKPGYTARLRDAKVQRMLSLYANALSDYCRGNANADQVETQQDHDMLVNGYGAIETALTYEKGYASMEANGEIVMDRIDPMHLIWSPKARKPNLLDTTFIGYRKEFDLEDAQNLIDKSIQPTNEETTDEDFEYYHNGGVYDKIREVGYEMADSNKKTVWVYFYQWYEVEPYWRTMNMLDTLRPDIRPIAEARLREIEQAQADDDFKFKVDDEIWIITKSIKSQIEEFLGNRAELFEYKRRVYYGALISGNKIFSKFKLVSQQGFTIKVKTGDFHEKSKIWAGIVNSMKDPVLFYNKSLTELMFTIAAASKGGVMYEEGSINKINEFESKYAKTDANVEVARNALVEGRIKPKREPYTPSGLEGLLQETRNALPEVVGIDKTFMGSSENKLEAARLQRQRVKQVINIFASYFDAITLYQKEHARMMLDMMRIFAENNHGALIHVMNEEGQKQFVTLLSDRLMSEFSVSIEEAPDSATEKEERAELLIGMGDKLIQVGDQSGKQIYAKAVKYLPLEPQDQESLEKLLSGEQIDPNYVKQLEQQLQKLQGDDAKLARDKAQAEIQKTQSETEKNQVGLQKTNAETIKTMEDAKSVAKQTDMIDENADVNVNI